MKMMITNIGIKLLTKTLEKSVTLLSPSMLSIVVGHSLPNTSMAKCLFEKFILAFSQNMMRLIPVASGGDTSTAL